jgi:hypothetical protein
LERFGPSVTLWDRSLTLVRGGGPGKQVEDAIALADGGPVTIAERRRPEGALREADPEGARGARDQGDRRELIFSMLFPEPLYTLPLVVPAERIHSVVIRFESQIAPGQLCVVATSASAPALISSSDDKETWTETTRLAYEPPHPYDSLVNEAHLISFSPRDGEAYRLYFEHQGVLPAVIHLGAASMSLLVYGGPGRILTRCHAALSELGALPPAPSLWPLNPLRHPPPAPAPAPATPTFIQQVLLVALPALRQRRLGGRRGGAGAGGDPVPAGGLEDQLLALLESRGLPATDFGLAAAEELVRANLCAHREHAMSGRADEAPQPRGVRGVAMG